MELCVTLTTSAKPSSLQTTVASRKSHSSSQIEPHFPAWKISTLPLYSKNNSSSSDRDRKRENERVKGIHYMQTFIIVSTIDQANHTLKSSVPFQKLAGQFRSIVSLLSPLSTWFVPRRSFLLNTIDYECRPCQ